MLKAFANCVNFPMMASDRIENIQEDGMSKALTEMTTTVIGSDQSENGENPQKREKWRNVVSKVVTKKCKWKSDSDGAPRIPLCALQQQFLADIEANRGDVVSWEPNSVFQLREKVSSSRRDILSPCVYVCLCVCVCVCVSDGIMDSVYAKAIRLSAVYF